MSKPLKTTDATQSERFKQMARELACDEDEDTFKEKLKQVARHRPKHDLPPPMDRG